MTLQELREKIESLGETMNFRITDVFSWRGSYRLPACSISAELTTKEENLAMIERLLSETFTGYKGGEYEYSDCDDINFEPGYWAWTDGRYLIQFILDNANNEDVRKIFS
jgi:hypothetical protein